MRVLAAWGNRENRLLDAAAHVLTYTLCTNRTRAFNVLNREDEPWRCLLSDPGLELRALVRSMAEVPRKSQSESA